MDRECKYPDTVFCFLKKLFFRKLEKNEIFDFFCRIPKQKWVEWITHRVPPRDRLNFENRSTLAVAIVQNPQKWRFFNSS